MCRMSQCFISGFGILISRSPPLHFKPQMDAASGRAMVGPATGRLALDCDMDSDRPNAMWVSFPGSNSVETGNRCDNSLLAIQ
jgi:hypothetical protein